MFLVIFPIFKSDISAIVHAIILKWLKKTLLWTKDDEWTNQKQQST